MRIVKAKFHVLQIPFKSSFNHSLRSRDCSDSVIVELTSDSGIKGYGEVVPRPYVTGETVESSIKHIVNNILPQISGCEFDGEADFNVLGQFCRSFSDASDNNTIAYNAAAAGVELALIDLCLRNAGKSFAALIPPNTDSVTYSAVITADSPESVVKIAQKCKHIGITRIKIKVGAGNDYERIALIRNIFGDSVSLRVDANCAFDVKAAIEFISSIESFNIASIEQPVSRSDINALAQVKKNSAIPVMADESLITEADARALIEHEACDIFNLRIAKNGGIFNTIRIAELARQANIRFQLGCQVGETAILSAAGRYLAAHLNDAIFVEGSYGTLLLHEDIAEQKVQFGYAGKATLLNGIGLGIDIRQEMLVKYAIETIEKSLTDV